MLQTEQMVAATFEHNSPYEEALAGLFQPSSNPNGNGAPWPQASFGLSLSKGAMLVLQHVAQRRAGVPYHRVVLSRPDILLDTPLSLLGVPCPGQGVVLTNHHPSKHGLKGDFYFVLPPDEKQALLRAFARLSFTAAREKIPLENHIWIERTLKASVTSAAGLSLRSAGGAQTAGNDVEVFRKLLESPIGCRGFGHFHALYGMEESEWRRLERLPARRWRCPSDM